MFDERFHVKPQIEGPDERPWWGGYEVRFKLLPKDKYTTLAGNLPKMQTNALVIGQGQARTFVVDFSKYEFTAGKEEREIDNYTIYVYTPAMIAIEKLRAICQQMPEYGIKGGRLPGLVTSSTFISSSPRQA